MTARVPSGTKAASPRALSSGSANLGFERVYGLGKVETLNPKSEPLPKRRVYNKPVESKTFEKPEQAAPKSLGKLTWRSRLP